MTAQTIRAVLFAIATVATRTGLRASRSASRGSVHSEGQGRNDYFVG
jgi:hypothetical protein